MKKNIKKISIVLIILTLIIWGININPTKAVTTTLSASGVTVESGKNFSINISSSVKLSGWTIKLTNNGGCTFYSASGGEVSGSSVYGTSQTGTNSLAKYTFTAPKVEKDTTYTISFSGSEMADATDSVNIVDNTSCSVKVTVKAKTTSSGNNGNTSSGNNSGNSGNSGNSNGSTTTTKPTTPTFKSANKTVYTTGDVNLRSSWSTKSAATLVEKGTELKLTGTSTEVIDGYTWYKVTYKGTTKYIASSLITETKPKEEEPKKSSNKNLSSLTIKGVELSPKFSKEVTQYTAKVDGDVTKLDITSKAEDSKAKVTVEGNKDLKEGDNVVKIKVTAEDETTRTYFITVTKGEETADNKELKLASLDIARVDFGESFKPDTFTYELSLNEYVKNLEITATPNQEDAKVEITGNDEFKAGKNMVVILLTSADGEQTATYQIEVNLPEEAIAKAEETSNSSTLYYIIAGVAIALALIIIVVVIIRSRSNRYDDEYEDEEEFEEEPEYIDNKLKIEEDEEEVKPTRKREPKVTVDDFLNIPDDDDDNKPPRRPRGRHSV